MEYENQLGKKPPYDTDLEEIVLGSVLLVKDAFLVAEPLWLDDLFYRSKHQIIASAIKELWQNSAPIDIVTVTNQLKRNNELEEVGGPVSIAKLTQRVDGAQNLEYHIRILQQYMVKRQMITIGNSLLKDAYEESSDALSLISQAEGNILSISDALYTKEATNIKDGLHEFFLYLNENIRLKKLGETTGVPSGLSLDDYTGGWQKSTLTIIAGRPAMGKSAAMNSATIYPAVQKGIPVGVFSCEMSTNDLITRMACHEAEIDSNLVKNGDVTDIQQQQFVSKTAALGTSKIFIDDTPGIDILELRSKAIKMRKNHGIELIFIDYLQLVTARHVRGNKGNREQEVSEVAQKLKDLSKELDIPVVALAQLSRAVEVRGGDKKPELSDLRESGNIEQAADLIIFLYRPEYYGIIEDESGNDLTGLTEWIVRKNRQGKIGSKFSRFIPEYSKFENINNYDFNQYPDNGERLPPAHEVDIRLPYSDEEGGTRGLVSGDNGELPF